MGGFYDHLPPTLADWIREQKVFWVASAPLSARGHVNVSPRAHDCFYIESPNSCWFCDMTGSGSETMSHLRESGNGRITILFNAFSGPPRIVRLYGKGKIFERDTPEFDKLLPAGDDRILPGTRCIVWIDFDVVGYSCGYTVPFMEYISDRDTLKEWTEGKLRADEKSPDGLSKNGLRSYWALKNYESIDGLPSLKRGIELASKGQITEEERKAFRIQRLPMTEQGAENIAKSRSNASFAGLWIHLPGFLAGIVFAVALRHLITVLAFDLG